MTGQEFLRWLEQSSMDALRKSSLDLQLVATLAEIMDVNPELLKRAIENRANLSSDSGSARRARRAAGLGDC